MRREEYRDLLLAESEESGKVTRERPPYADALLKRCEEGDPKYTLNECFRDVSKEVLLDLLDTMGSSGNESLNQEILLAKLIHAVVDLERMQTRLPMLAPLYFDAIYNVYNHGGVLEVHEQDARSSNVAPFPYKPLLWCYYNNKIFTYVLPQEVLETLQHVDWPSLYNQNRAYSMVNTFVERAAQFLGIISFEELYESYTRVIPEHLQLPQTTFMVIVTQDAMDEYSGIEIINIDDTSYVTETTLAEQYREDLFRAGVYVNTQDRVIQGPKLGKIADLLVCKALIPLCDIPYEAVQQQDLTDWLWDFPDVKALLELLTSAFKFSEPDMEVQEICRIEDILFTVLCIGIEEFDPFDKMLENCTTEDFALSEDTLEELEDHLQDLLNCIPRWYYNGWSYYEACAKGFFTHDALQSAMDAERPEYPAVPAWISTGSRMTRDAATRVLNTATRFGIRTQQNSPVENFNPLDYIPVNPIIAHKEPGRNDPCPCGSGKKYKKCCGKARV